MNCIHFGPTRGTISDFGHWAAVGPHGAMDPQHTPALAHNALKPQAIARRRAFRKATHRFALDLNFRLGVWVNSVNFRLGVWVNPLNFRLEVCMRVTSTRTAGLLGSARGTQHAV
jgi:hypothetical protein